MKLGLVKHLNARPLTYGLEVSKDHELIYENPSVLKDSLLEGKLDAALISSVECVRNMEVLSYCNKVGVCSEKKVRSILFFQNKNEPFPPEIVYTDSGSRSSVALLQVLLKIRTGKIVKMESTPATEILQQLNIGSGSHLLFGDHALQAKWDNDLYKVEDLAQWWNRETKLSFCFAFWAYPKTNLIPDAFFIESLEYGFRHIPEIMKQNQKLPEDILKTYFKEDLHYYTTEKDLSGFKLFIDKCIQYDIL